MKVSVAVSNGAFFEFGVTPDSTFQDLKHLIEAQTQIPHQRMQLLFKGDGSIADSAKLRDVGVEDTDMIACEIARQQERPPANLIPAQGQQGQIANLIPPQFRHLLGGPLGGPMMRQPTAEEINKRRAVEQNRNYAVENMPEAFADVLMLYVDTEINGAGVKAFVDSGAQRTVMSRACAERCGIIDLVDTQFAGMAVGVGTSRILGRVHYCPIKIGDEFYGCSLIVLDQSMNIDVLLGLDMLKKYRCNIDLGRNVLRFGETGKEVDFLPESGVPEHAKLSNK